MAVRWQANVCKPINRREQIPELGRFLRSESVDSEFLDAELESCATIFQACRRTALNGHLKSGQRWSLQNRPTDAARDAMVLR